MTVPTLLLLLSLLGASFFFSGSEAACFSLGPAEQEACCRRGWRGRCLRAILARPRRLLFVLLLGNLLVNVWYFSRWSDLIAARGDGAMGKILWYAGTGVTVILLAEILPKAIGVRVRQGWSLAAAPFLWLCERLLLPFLPLIEVLLGWIERRILSQRSREAAAVTSEDLKMLVDLAQERGQLGDWEGERLSDLLDFGNLTVKEVMTPRVALTAFPLAVTREELLASEWSRTHAVIPLYEGSVDHIVGTVRLAALAAAPGHPPAALLVPPRFVPETLPLEDLLREFRDAQGIVVVLDEYGGTAGLATFTDVIGELAGETAWDPPRPGPEGSLEVPGDLPVRDWASWIGEVSSGSGSPVTLGGLVLNRLGHFPEVGERVALGEVEVAVAAIVRRRITRLRVRVRKEGA